MEFNTNNIIKIAVAKIPVSINGRQHTTRPPSNERETEDPDEVCFCLPPTLVTKVTKDGRRNTTVSVLPSSTHIHSDLARSVVVCSRTKSIDVAPIGLFEARDVISTTRTVSA